MKKTIAQLAREAGIVPRTLRSRIERGMSLRQALAIRTTNANTKHGHASPRTREYRAWIDMISRCKYHHRPGNHNYAGRGIKVCELWKKDFMAFYQHVGPCPPGHELDRKRVNEDYKPGNVRWVTHKENSRNMRKTQWVTYRGKTQSVSAWAEELGLNRRKIADRLHRAGWSVSRAFKNAKK